MGILLDLKELREEMRLTQREAAQIIGVSPRTLQNWERGKPHPSAGKLKYITKKFNEYRGQIGNEAFTDVIDSHVCGPKCNAIYLRLDAIQKQLTAIETELQALRNAQN